jgi:hypothetical protein
MEKYKRHLWIVLSAAIIWSAFLILLILKPNLWHALAQDHVLFFVLACAGTVPICLYYPLAKRLPHFAIGLAVIAGGLVLTSAYSLARHVFNFDNVWTDGIYFLSRVLIPLGGLIFIFQAVKRSQKQGIRKP